MNYIYKIQVLILSLCSFALSGQAILINEVVSSNAVHLDEDGDTPDWFELYNTTSDAINLEGWTASDRKNTPAKWTFPHYLLQPDNYLQVWASDKDRTQFGLPRTVIAQGSPIKYVRSQVSNTIWTTNDYNDGQWTTATAGIGYGDGDDETIVPDGTLSVLIRIPFEVNSPESVSKMIFDIDFDDAYVAYINGIEISRSNIIQEGNGTYVAATDREAQLYIGGDTEQHILSNVQELLSTGENVLAIRLVNVSSFSSDLSCIPFLTLMMPEGSSLGTTPPNSINIPTLIPHTNFKLSNAGETLYLFDNLGQLVDSLAFANIPQSTSYGRLEDGSLGYFETPTPGAKNSGDSFEGAITEQVIFSNQGGLVDELDLTLSANLTASQIRYTLDATLPDINSALYSGPIEISNNTVVRARIFKPGLLASHPSQRTYILNADHDLPIIGLVSDPKNLFDVETGIYAYGNTASDEFPHFGANFWEDWERPVSFTIYEEGSPTFEAGAGVKIFGGWSRGHDQKSLSLHARSVYGDSSFDYKMFDNRPTDSYQTWVLRNSGNDFLNSNIRDATLTSLMEGADLEVQAMRPMVAYINGTYWGYYHLREKINEHFINERTGLNQEDIDIVEADGKVIHGSSLEYNTLVDFISNNSLAIGSNFQQVVNQIDIQNFALYYATQIYFDNRDWPGNNIKYWKAKNGKWRWILFDTDFGFGVWDQNAFTNNTLLFALNPAGPNWPNPPWSTLLFRRLMTNTTFKNIFVNTLADELNTRFLPDRVSNHIDHVAGLTDDEAFNHYNRWDGEISERWRKISDMKGFAANRPQFLKNYVLNTLDLPSFHSLILKNPLPNRGSVIINNRLNISQASWTGDYFRSVPISLEAVAAEGYRFSHWEGDVQSMQPKITANIDKLTNITAIFESSTNTIDLSESTYFKVYPSPSDGLFTISSEQHIISSGSIEVFDTNGSRIFKLVSSPANMSNTITIDLTNQPSGNYQIRLTTAKGIVSRLIQKL